MTELDTWLEAFPREEVERNIRELESALLRWRNALAIHDSLTGPKDGDRRDEAQGTPTKPQAIALILKEAGRPLESGEIRAEMIKRGWLPDGAKARKRFYSTMSRLKSEDRIEHRSDGRYVLPEPKGAPLKLA